MTVSSGLSNYCLSIRHYFELETYRLTLQTESLILGEFDNGRIISKIATKYGIDKSTVGKTKKKLEEIPSICTLTDSGPLGVGH